MESGISGRSAIGSAPLYFRLFCPPRGQRIRNENKNDGQQHQGRYCPVKDARQVAGYGHGPMVVLLDHSPQHCPQYHRRQRNVVSRKEIANDAEEDHGPHAHDVIGCSV